MSINRARLNIKPTNTCPYGYLKTHTDNIRVWHLYPSIDAAVEGRGMQVYVTDDLDFYPLEVPGVDANRRYIKS